MKEFNKEEYNKLCAEFLKLKEAIAYETDKYGYYQAVDGYMTPFSNIAGHELNSSSFIHSIAQLKFHSDWNWIMEVVEKIENTYGVSIIGSPITPHTCSIFLGNNESIVVERDSKKEAVVQAIWEFLNWYSQQNNNL